jgi:nucleoside-diphosphate-sugar epimerase
LKRTVAELSLQRVLITGGTGLVGQSLVEALVRAGQRVRVFQRGSLPRGPELWRAVERAEGDVADARSLAVAMASVDAVVHAAGARSGDAALMWRANAIGSRLVAQAARAAGVRRFVQLSSAGVYGHSSGEPFAEGSATRPDDAYGHSKLEGESGVRAALAGSSTAWVVLRPFGVYGPRRLDLFREVQRRKIWLYGPTRNVVHPTHVDDVVQATLAALERAEQPGVRGEVFNVAGERALEHAALVRLVAERLGVSVRCLTTPSWVGDGLQRMSQLGDVVPAALRRPRLVSRAGDTSKARARLGFEPERLELALDATIQAARSARQLS